MSDFTSSLKGLVASSLDENLVPQVVWGVVSNMTGSSPVTYEFTPEGASQPLSNQWPFLGADPPNNGDTVGGLWVGTDLFLLWNHKGTPANTTPIPIGTLLDFAGQNAPSGFLVCDGSAVSRTTYANLFAVLGENFGSGDGSTTFNLPDMRGRASFGVGTLNTNTQPSIPLGATGGENAHTLVTAEIPAHTHTDSGHGHTDSGHGHVMYDPGHAHNSPSSGGDFVTGVSSTIGLVATSTNQAAFQTPTVTTSGSGTSVDTGNAQITTGNAQNQNTGGGGAHNNMPPFMGLNKIIKY